MAFTAKFSGGKCRRCDGDILAGQIIEAAAPLPADEAAKVRAGFRTKASYRRWQHAGGCGLALDADDLSFDAWLADGPDDLAVERGWDAVFAAKERADEERAFRSDPDYRAAEDAAFRAAERTFRGYDEGFIADDDR